MADTLKFEEALAALGEIVNKLESGEVSLEESIELYEKGMKLSKKCTELLEKAEQKVQFLQQQEVGTAEND